MAKGKKSYQEQFKEAFGAQETIQRLMTVRTPLPADMDEFMRSQETILAEVIKANIRPVLLMSYKKKQIQKLVQGVIDGKIFICAIIPKSERYVTGERHRPLTAGQILQVQQASPNSVDLTFNVEGEVHILPVSMQILLIDQNQANGFLGLNKGPVEEEEEVNDAELNLLYINNPRDRDGLIIEEAERLMTEETASLSKETLLDKLELFVKKNQIEITRSRLSRILPYNRITKKKSAKAL